MRMTLWHYSLFEDLQGEEPLDTGGGRVFSLDASFGLLATASASALALFLGSALCCCGVSCMTREINKQNIVNPWFCRWCSSTCSPPTPPARPSCPCSHRSSNSLHLKLRTCRYGCISLHLCMCKCTYIHLDIYIYMYVCVYMCLYVCISLNI